MKNCIVGQSGGPTTAINASLCGVICEAAGNTFFDKVFGSLNGIEGILEENIVDLTPLASGDDIDLLKITPASFLGSCRKKLPSDLNDDIYKNIFKVFEKYNIGAFFYIGGNDSMDTVGKLSAYAEKTGSDIRIIGIPKTVDNDLPSTDHTPGFGSAAKYVSATIREIGIDTSVYYLKSVTIVEIMGRDAGWLTAASSLARSGNLKTPHLIYLPETTFDDDKFIDDINNLHKNGINSVVVAVSEGIRYADGCYVCEKAASVGSDNFGNKMLSGTAKFLELLVKNRIGCKARGIELNLPQRCAGHLLSKTDIDESFRAGAAAVNAAANGETSKMVCFKRISSSPYRCDVCCCDIKNALLPTTTVPSDWIENGNDVNGHFADYASPLIQGEITPVFEDGLPKYLCLKDLNLKKVKM